MAASGIAALLGLLTAMPVVAAPPTLVEDTNAASLTSPAAATTTWGWLVARKPQASIIPTKLNQATSAHATSRYFHVDTGEYLVYLGGIADNGGVALVSALGTSPTICDAVQWGSLAADETVRVQCFDQQGNLTDSRFVVDFLAVSGTGGRVAYAWVDRPGDSNSTPDLDYQYESRGKTITASRVVGLHGLTLPLLGQLSTTKGNVVVSGFRPLGAGPPTACSVVKWDHGLARKGGVPDMLVYVRCRDVDGTVDDDRLFEVLFTQSAGLKGQGGTRVAYLRADQPTTGSYTPDAHFSYSSAGTMPHVTRTGTGAYAVRLPGMPKGGSAQVSAFGAKARHCVVASIRHTAPQIVGVRCFDFSGNLADAKFTLSYAR